ncbi:transposase helper protein B, Fragment (plasmid) [Aromatoleum aromaticum EbN1]|uniref:Transposase helper protein B n=1 Tax=Aromatoleum aromaticum (strain DSM 19018 / LMG 30748 / EbN1) TaxID=76114 RepID=Q5NW85_AROAE|nr:transposase helper protein B, Fragment [Aromatoleum aromaticum EbN1]
MYGNDRRLRVWLEEQDRSYVLAIARTQHLWRETMRQQRARAIAQEIPDSGWQRLSAGDGAKGPRLYDWAFVPMLSWMTSQQRGLLVRRSLGEDRELAYYAVYAPFGTALPELVRVAGRRWAIEEGFEASKQLVGLDHYEVRSWTG